MRFAMQTIARLAVSPLLFILLAATPARSVASWSAEANSGGRNASARLPPQCPTKARTRSPDHSEKAKSHRRFDPPVVEYVQGESPGKYWGFPVSFLVDASGKVTCYSVQDFVNLEPVEVIRVRLNKRRRLAIAQMAAAGYEPFLENGKPIAASVAEDVREVEMPRERVPPPDVPPEAVVIEMSRAGCYGDMCADYSVKVHGDGRVRFEGKNTHVKGVQEYRIAPEAARALVQSVRDKDLWSLRSKYLSPRWTHKPFLLRLQFGGETREIADVSGEDAGMPVTVTQFENEVDRVAGTAMWTRLNVAGVEQLRAAGFDFKSPEAQRILSRVFFFGNAEEAAVVRLLELGMPADSYRTFTPPNGQEMRISALHDAASAGMVSVVQALLRRGGHLTDGRVDQRRLDEAFVAAIHAGRLGSVKALWEAGGPASRPSLTRPGAGASSEAGTSGVRHAILALHHDADDERPWDGLDIVRWYASQGGDIRVRDGDGDNLLEVGIDAGDERLVRFVLERGVDPNLPGTYGRRPLDVAYSESMSMILLEAGADIRLFEDGAAGYVARARRWKWQRVLDWLDSHSRKAQNSG